MKTMLTTPRVGTYYFLIFQFKGFFLIEMTTHSLACLHSMNPAVATARQLQQCCG